jgi:hypothetical protein
VWYGDTPSDHHFFDVVPISFRPQLKSVGNPVHDNMPVRLRLSAKVSWLSKETSDGHQRLTVKFLLAWSAALFKDLKAFGRGNAKTQEQLLKMRAMHPNIMVHEGSWNEQVKQMRVSLGCINAFCVHPSVHADTFCDTAVAVAEHKIACWTGKN